MGRNLFGSLGALRNVHVHLANLPTLPKSPQFISAPGDTVLWLWPVDKCDYSAARAALSLGVFVKLKLHYVEYVGLL